VSAALVVMEDAGLEAKKKDAHRRWCAAKRELKAIMNTEEYVAYIDGDSVAAMPAEIQARYDKARTEFYTTQQELESLGVKLHTPAQAAKERRQRKQNGRPLAPAADKIEAEGVTVSEEKKIIRVVPHGRSTPINITIDPEFASLIAPLGSAEYAQLEASLRASISGPRDAIVVWESPEKELILLDGHNRVAILTKLEAEENLDTNGIACDVDIIRQEFMQLPTRADALLWIEENQVSRRNLTDDQRAVIWDSIRDRRSAIAKSERSAKANEARNGDDSSLSANLTDKQPPDPVPAPAMKRDTRKEVAAESGLPESKLRSVAQLKKSNPEKVEQVRAGKISLREATKEAKSAKPAPKPAPLTWKEVIDWQWTFREQVAFDIGRLGTTQNVNIKFEDIDPATAKKLAEYYLRLKAGHA
jgi:hypothetical protein